MRALNFYPRQIKPELIDAGDEITVTHKVNGGITASHRGVARFRSSHGETHSWHTEEGSILVAWEVGVTPPAVTLHKREAVTHSMLEGVF